MQVLLQADWQVSEHAKEHVCLHCCEQELHDVLDVPSHPVEQLVLHPPLQVVEHPVEHVPVHVEEQPLPHPPVHPLPQEVEQPDEQLLPHEEVQLVLHPPEHDPMQPLLQPLVQVPVQLVHPLDSEVPEHELEQFDEQSEVQSVQVTFFVQLVNTGNALDIARMPITGKAFLVASLKNSLLVFKYLFSIVLVINDCNKQDLLARLPLPGQSVFFVSDLMIYIRHCTNNYSSLHNL